MSEIADRIVVLLGDLAPAQAREVLTEVANRVFIHKPKSPTASARTTPEAVWQALVAACGGDDPAPEDFSDVDGIHEGLRRIDFTLENFECKPRDYGPDDWKNVLGPRMFGSVPGIGCYGGGDWEEAVLFIVYLAADGKTLCTYVPKEGNTWNYQTNSAFGNDEEQDVEFLTRWLAENRPDVTVEDVFSDLDVYAGYMFNEEKFISDISANVPVSG